MVADTLAAFVDPALASYHTLSTAGAWLAMLGYTFQLYFDFSGYSTMAVGLGYLFGLRIPQNFNSPYKALDPSRLLATLAHLAVDRACETTSTSRSAAIAGARGARTAT